MVSINNLWPLEDVIDFVKNLRVNWPDTDEDGIGQPMIVDEMVLFYLQELLHIKKRDKALDEVFTDD